MSDRVVRFKDYYETMDVGRDATADEIKRSYRRLARKYHPDAGEFSDFFESLFGGAGHRRWGGGYTHIRTKSEDIHARIAISLEDAFLGRSRRLALDLIEEIERLRLLRRASGYRPGRDP